MNAGPTASPSHAARSRAAALPPEERRARIVAVTIPLLLAHGTAVTTRQIAEAAGIAEGTIFRVFPDKDSLLAAAVESALDSTSVDAALDAIDPELPLEHRLATAVDILRRRMADLVQLRTIVGTSGEAGSTDLTRIAKLFEPDAHRFRRDPVQCAHLLRGLTIAGTHPALVHDAPLGSDEIVSLLLDGIRHPGDASATGPEETSR